MINKYKDNLTLVIYSFLTLMFIIASFYQEDAEVYIFPRIISILMGILILFMWIDALKQNEDNLLEVKRINWKSLIPGFVIGIVYVMLLEQLGFYVMSFLAFFLIISIYGVRSTFNIKALVLKLGISALFIACIYLLFGKLLNVITPKGVLF